jgi:hypothetical protein
MDRRKFIQIMGVGVAASIPAGAGLALGANADPTAESSVTYRQDGSISIEGQIQYSQTYNGYVVQALVPSGVHGQYLITNPDDKSFKQLAKTGKVVTVQGMLDGGALLLLVQTVDGKTYGSNFNPAQLNSPSGESKSDQAPSPGKSTK